MDDELSKPQIKEGDTKISFMAEVEPSEVKEQMEEQIEKKVAKLGKSRVALKMADKIMAVGGEEKQGMSSVGIQMAQFIEEVEKAQKEFDRAEVKLRFAKMDKEEFEQFQEDELNRCNPDDEYKINCAYCGKEVDGSYVDSGNSYCNPTCATNDFKKRLKEHDKNCGLCNPDGEIPKEDYLTLEQLQKRMGRIKDEDYMLSDEEIKKLKQILDAQKDTDVLTAQEMEKLKSMLGSPIKEASTSPTIAKLMPTNSIVAPQEEIAKVLEKAKEGTVIKEDELPQEIKERVEKKIKLDEKTVLNDATEERCPKCKGKLKKKGHIAQTDEGKFASLELRCENSKRKWYWLWLRKPRCDYFDGFIQRID
jgi:hypothetical protein